MMLELGVEVQGMPELEYALATLKISLQKKIVHSATRSSAGPVAKDLRKHLRAISRHSDRGTFTLARNIGVKIHRTKRGIPRIIGIIGPKRRVQGPPIKSIQRKTRKRRTKPLPDSADGGARQSLAALRKRQGKKSLKLRHRVPSRYFHFLERGFTNWQTGRRIAPKAPMRKSARMNKAASIARFRDTALRGIIRETIRNNRGRVRTG